MRGSVLPCGIRNKRLRIERWLLSDGVARYADGRPLLWAEVISSLPPEQRVTAEGPDARWSYLTEQVSLLRAPSCKLEAEIDRTCPT